MARNVFDEDDNSWGELESKSIWDLDDNPPEESRSPKFNFKLNTKIAAISAISILGIAVLASVVPGLLGGSEEPKPQPTAVQTSAVPVSWQEQMLSSLNMIRAENGLEPLKLCNTLNKSAQSYAEVMATQNFFAHEGKDGSTPSQRAQSAGYVFYGVGGVGENIATGQASIEEVMTGWKNSPGHFKNMINSEYMHVGFGMAINQETTYKTWWVQNFGYGGKC